MDKVILVNVGQDVYINGVLDTHLYPGYAVVTTKEVADKIVEDHPLWLEKHVVAIDEKYAIASFIFADLVDVKAEEKPRNKKQKQEVIEETKEEIIKE
jgi:hypothetical protein